MATASVSATRTIATLADLLDQLGDIPPERVRARPLPGTATEQDVIDVEARENRLCELVDGVLVEKATGFYESRLAVVLVYLLESYLEKNNRGIVVGADGTIRLMPGLIRIPDVSFVSWKRLPSHELPSEPIPDLVPDLAVEVLSESNTTAEMRRKVREYFEAGVRLVWLLDPETRQVTVHTSPARTRIVREHQTLDGGRVLPGFELPLRQWFRRAGRRRR
jgi:Uma2 family endonuclease